ncbi:hypothetical protein [Streptomyces sp. NPDC001880]
MGEPARIHAAWGQIEAWLHRHAPRTLETLNNPVDEDGIREAERVLGLRFPPGLVASLQRHDGARGQLAGGELNPAAFCLPSEHRLLPASEIVAQTLLLRSAQDSDNGGG